MKTSTSLWILLNLLLRSDVAHGHMEMVHPPPIKSKYNRFYNFEDIDYSYNDPLGVFPCKGYHTNEPRVSTEHYLAGEVQRLTIEGTADHDGGSCQVSLSYDAGKTFHVIKSIIGGCPVKRTYEFQIPANAPHGQALLSWTWISRIGNRDFYQNCAWVDIINFSNIHQNKDLDLTFHNPEPIGPPMFVAQIPGTCVIAEGYEFVYPEPGKQIEYGGDPENYTIICEECYPSRPVAQAVFGVGITEFWKNEYNMSCVMRNRQTTPRKGL